MIFQILILIATSLIASVAMIGFHAIASYAADPRQFMNRPMIIHRHPWLGTVAGLLSICVLVLVALNGWLYFGIFGVAFMIPFWLTITNPLVRLLTTYRGGAMSMLISNPFLQVATGGIGLAIATAFAFLRL